MRRRYVTILGWRISIAAVNTNRLHHYSRRPLQGQGRIGFVTKNHFRDLRLILSHGGRAGAQMDKVEIAGCMG